LATNHFDRISSNLRQDLLDGFERVRRESIAKIKPDEAAALVTKMWSDKKLDSFVIKEFTAAALAGLVANGEPSDAEIARSHLHDEAEEIRVEAVRILERFGNVLDSEVLASIATTTSGELQEIAALTALKLAPGPEGAVRQLLASEKSRLVALAVRALLNEDETKAATILEPLLDSKDDTPLKNTFRRELEKRFCE
jgi:hypothetical protein